MAEVRKIVCDMCGRDIETGYVIKQAARRRIRGGSATVENYRFDLCTHCFDRIARECKKDADAARDGAADAPATKWRTLPDPTAAEVEAQRIREQADRPKGEPGGQ